MAAPLNNQMMLSQLATVTDGRLIGIDTSFAAVSIDSRTLVEGELFIALTGPNFDGHAFVAAAEQRGAVALLVEREVESQLPQVVVSDTRHALGQLASAWRSRYRIPLIAVTGSNGKTTVKEMLASILAQSVGNAHGVLATSGNLNNDLGVPLTLMRLNSGHRYAVIEMGANHFGEIRYLTNLTQPTVALINNAGPAHLEGFGDIEGVANAKGEIFEGLGEEGVAVFNADDRYVEVWRGLCTGKTTRTFGISEAADVAATELQLGECGYRFKLNVDNESIDVALQLAGRHNVMNALAAATAALAAGATLQAVRDGLQAVVGVKGRLQLRTGGGGVTVIDDTYNANPASLQAALDVLNDARDGKKILALGDMGELGDQAQALHTQMGRQASAARIDRIFTVGQLARHAADAFGDAAHHFTSQQALIAELRRTLAAADGGVTVLVKGSRTMQMERVVAALLDSNARTSGGLDRGVPQARTVGAEG